MMGLLRVVRGFVGFLLLMQIFGLVISLLWIQHPAAAHGHGLASVLSRFAFLLFSGGLFFGLRTVINRLHLKKHGVPHPALADKPWAL